MYNFMHRSNFAITSSTFSQLSKLMSKLPLLWVKLVLASKTIAPVKCHLPIKFVVAFYW
jgi:hypothetical protein